ncbi:FAD-dependent monooxygenase [Paractinoplanes atraurantiacus]|uniref:2-polyprenyl-6-methoxyphenol hydroxylase n=1 Tax=Paractinoplanes atraurantiacus TaxID=1036182 RepID=A0A285J072_9ACTN|nr:FAD-dependent monooxygenase [Actinoplanes atraurantiacus]SNY53634.1 2-polyprenyl-6-methoxyphenol hydroxylase [Actinoplanes atraurantiacus]
MQNTRRALVVGLGIAGMAAAVRLRSIGWTTVVVERTPQRRTGGYFVGLFPSGERAARDLGVLSTMHLRTPADHRTWAVDGSGARQRSVGFLDQPGHPDGVLRGDIEAALWEKLDGQAEVRLGTEPVHIEQTARAARVTLRDSATGETYEQEYDLVVGADGLRSTVRRLVFGPHEQFMRSLHTIICAFSLDRQVSGYGDHEQIVIAEPRRALWIFPFRDHPPTALFTYRTDDIDAQFRGERADVLAARFAGLDAGGIVTQALGALRHAPQALFDSVHQVRMPRWHRGRVVLIGDAAWCLTLFSGMGASSGMIGAVALGDELARAPESIGDALRAYDKRMRPLVRRHQRLAYVKAQLFVPSSVTIAKLRAVLLRMVTRQRLHAWLGRPS